MVVACGGQLHPVTNSVAFTQRGTTDVHLFLPTFWFKKGSRLVARFKKRVIGNDVDPPKHQLPYQTLWISQESSSSHERQLTNLMMHLDMRMSGDAVSKHAPPSTSGYFQAT